MKRSLTSPQLSEIISFWLVAISLLLISACSAQLPEKKSEYSQPDNNQLSAQQIPPKPETVPELKLALPEVKLTEELLYTILVASFAEERGDLKLANSLYLRSAIDTRDPRLAKRATQIAIFSKNYNDALTAAQLWVELKPNNLDARQSAASLLLQQGRLEDAEPHLIWILEQDNRSTKRQVALANLMARSPKGSDVISLFEKITSTANRSSSQVTDTLYATAILAQKRGKQDIALNRLEQLLTINPNHADGILLRAKLWFAHDKTEDAMQSLVNYLKVNPENFAARLTYARMLVDTRALKEALTQFGVLAKQAPRNHDIVYGYGILAIQNNQLDIAEEQFLNLIHLKLREAEARQSMGQIFEIRNQTDEAINWYRSVPKGEHFFASQLRAAQLISKRDGLQPARDFLNKIPASDSTEELQKLVIEAELLQGDQQYEESFKLFSMALKESPDNPDLLYAHAMAAEKIGRIDILEQNLTKVLEADPKNIQALNALGYTLADRTDRISEAFEYIQRAYALDSKDPAILDSMGWALYRMGRHKEALEYLLRASREHQDGEIYAHLGEVLWVSGDTRGARAIWDAALKFDPNHPVLKKTLKRFVP